MSTVDALKAEDVDVLLLRSSPGLRVRLLGWFMNLAFTDGRFPPGFRRTMAVRDSRLDEMCIGLGVVTKSTQRFYPKDQIGDGIEDEVDGQPLHIVIGDVDAVPYAVRSDDTRPIQLFSRWYGFSLTYPGCEVYSA